MKALQEYKKFISEVQHLFWVFTDVEATATDKIAAHALKTWTIDEVEGYAAGASRYRPDERIKEELIGDAPDQITLQRMLDYVKLELADKLPDTYFPLYDEAYYNDDNKVLVEALESINGNIWAHRIAQQLHNTAFWANTRVKATWQMLERVSEFAGYNMDAQSLNPELNQGKLLYYCQIAEQKGYLERIGTGYKRKVWSKALLAYFLGHFPNQDGTFPDKRYCQMFGEHRLGKALTQLADNKNGDGKPIGYEIIDELLKM